MKVISTCCHFSLNNVPVTYLVYLHDVPQCPTILVTTHYAWIGYFITLVLYISTTITPHISQLMTACFFASPSSSLFSFFHLLLYVILSFPPLRRSELPSHSTTSSARRTCLRSWVSPPTHRSYGHTSRSSLLVSASGVPWGEHLYHCHKVARRRGVSP